MQDGHKLRNISNRDSDFLLRNNLTDGIIIKELQIETSFSSMFGLLNQNLSRTRGAVNINSKIFIVVPCILITLKFLSLTNARLYYTYKMLKYTARLSHDCSYLFRSTWTIIREPMPNLAKVTVLWK